MIQRIQSVWLLLAAATVFLVVKFPFAGGIMQTGAVKELFAAGNLLMFMVALLLGIVALVAIFLFKKRPVQKNLIWLGCLLSIVFIVMMYYQMEQLKDDPLLTEQSFKIGATFPILYIILLVMAYSGIRKDEKLIKSVNRLR
jgi:peptidoglycan/LPS O-acetylase OafA/YrhL